MLGITVPDAIALGTLIIAVLAALRGGKAGEYAKRAVPPDPPMAMIGGAIVDTATLASLVVAVSKLTEALTATAAERRKGHEERIERLLERLEEAEHEPRHRRR